MKFIQTKLETLLFSLLILFLPTQVGKHFWPDFAYINGIRVDYLSPTVYVTDLLAASLIVIWIYKTFVTRTYKVHFTKWFWMYSTFCLYLLFNALFSANILNGLYSLLKFVECSFIAFYAIITIPVRFSYARISLLLAIGVIGESLLAFAQYFTQGSIGGLFYLLGERTFSANTPGIANAVINGELVMRAYGTFSHPNVLAGYLIISMIFIFFFLFSSKQKLLTYIASLAILLGTASLFLTLSRIGIGIWLTLLLFLFIRQVRVEMKQKSKKALMLLITSLGICFIISSVFIQTLLPRFMDTAFTEESFIQRVLLNEVAFTMFRNNILFGIGLGNFLPELIPLRVPFTIGVYFQPVHNIFLLVAAETGLVGLVSLLSICTFLFYRLLNGTLNNYRTCTPLFLSLSIILLWGFFDHYWLTLQQGQLLFSLVLGLSFHQSIHSFQLGKAKITRKRDPK